MNLVESRRGGTARHHQGNSYPPVTRKTYPIVETFHSVQGEGLWTGVSAFFIRLAGCDVGCPWCDTKISWSTKPHGQVAVADLVQQAQAAQPFMVVITGGEPLMHDLAPLTQSLKQAGLRLHLETSGAHPLSGQFDWISLSPKRFKPPQPEIYAHAHELKVVIANAEDLAWAEEQAAQVPATTVKLLQPEWTSEHSQQLVFDYVKQHSGWRISLQTHKFLGVR
ncbi:7-carboxy-7-deazaguanine synthase QueE [Leptothoe spongobia]|uniref:7-carboxy-7-deazaguanine synthase n=1 Tax=Leptothoe spongobia TAU-MAC 1115 TaxID=1967444 RepID=A0A947DH06_9CYAN|nr:7-carboxy-7-deazaguanine synthase QueE [Leptothoe spongobia]MBT9316913.1 7-carboxy-7-deazaguanine synthase QueE [Leptothoe spongobia TAU-MAC 1115]